ncbi:hypothetical protein ACFW9L_23155 [Streptomyces sp. NPDC059517]|uniref:hypothetical protein n=1 Tax=Streptomyces sp. NPDC059517 TaxID=3346855 RepID=UPI003678F5BE
MHKGWPKRWWTTALVAVTLAGIVVYDVWWIAKFLTEPEAASADWWELAGRCLGGTWFAFLGVATAQRATALRRATAKER